MIEIYKTHPQCFHEIIIDRSCNTAKIKKITRGTACKTDKCFDISFNKVFCLSPEGDRRHPNILFTHDDNYYTFVGAVSGIQYFQHNSTIIDFRVDEKQRPYAVDDNGKAILFLDKVIVDYTNDRVYFDYFDKCNLTKSKPEEYGRFRYKEVSYECDFYTIYLKTYRDNTAMIQYKGEWIDLTYEHYREICEKFFAENNYVKYESTLPAFGIDI
jgi:hypothetical protein